MTTIFFLLLLCFMFYIKIMIQSLYLIHKLQLLSYDNLKFVKWLEGNQYRSILIWNLFELLIPLLIIVILYFNVKSYQIKFYKYVTSFIMILVFTWKISHPFLAGWIGKKAQVKKPLVFTARVKRLLFTLSCVVFCLLFFVLISTIMPFDRFTLSTLGFFQFNAFVLLLSVLTPIILFITNIINTPLEKLIHFSYFIQAKNKLKKSALINIGITGSFGKTSTKFFAAQLLSRKYKTLTTPASYNTPMGLSKIINQEQLDQYHYFVAEMGADHVGDIAVLCNLVQPQYGILTAIGQQHLETFQTQANIIKTKFALLESIPETGFGVYNYDQALIRENIKNFAIKAPLYSYTIEEKFFDQTTIYGKNIIHTRQGLNFEAVYQNKSLPVTTDLLGKHNAQNLLAAILMAKLLGLSDPEIQAGINTITPIEHRLQKIDPGTGILVLDDAFNSNLKGAIEAINVLNEIEGNKKVIVTPGLVELGEEEDKVNQEFGKHIAQKTDIAILVGPEKTKNIYQSIQENGMNKNLFVVRSLPEVQTILKDLLSQGDVVLFENDLPDTYSE